MVEDSTTAGHGGEDTDPATSFVAATGALKTVEKVPSQAEAKVKAKVKARR